MAFRRRYLLVGRDQPGDLFQLEEEERPDVAAGDAPAKRELQRLEFNTISIQLEIMAFRRAGLPLRIEDNASPLTNSTVSATISESPSTPSTPSNRPSITRM